MPLEQAGYIISSLAVGGSPEHNMNCCLLSLL